MSKGNPIQIRYSEEERSRLEQAAVLAGYQYVSAYIRDKSLDRIHRSDVGIGGIESWAERQELTGRLAELEQSQKTLQTFITVLLYLATRKATTGEISDLRATLELSGIGNTLLETIAPELGALIKRLTEEK